MRILHTLFAGLALLGGAFAGSQAASAAEPWPRETIRVIVPFAPGGLTDLIGRTFAQELAKSLEAKVIVENRAGASGLIGTELVARAKPDGNTLLIGGGIVVLADALYPKLGFSPRKDLVPVSLIERNGLVLITAKDSGRFSASALSDVIAHARKEPGGIPIASFGNGSFAHMAIEMMASESKSRLMHVAYRGTSQAMPDIIGGQVPLMFDNIVTALPLLHSDKIRAIAYTGHERAPQLPNVPTFRELGMPNTEVFNFFGLYVPAGTPAAITQRLNAEVNQIFRRPEIKAKFSELGAETVPGTAKEFSDFLDAERLKWGAIIKDKNIRPE